MRTRCSFQLETFVRSGEPITVKTAKGSVVLAQERSETVNAAMVEVNCSIAEGAYECAREELIKALLYALGKGSRIVDHRGCNEIPDSAEGSAAVGGYGTVRVVASLVVDNAGHPQGLRINVNSPSPAIAAYYEASIHTNPVVAFREYFKIIEYFSGVTEQAERDKDRIVGSVGRSWDIPVPVVESQRHSGESDDKVKKRLAGELYDLRGKASHLRPDYGLVPTNLAAVAEYSNHLPVIEAVARHSLETNPETRLSA